MEDPTRTKFISDVDMKEQDVRIGQPFKISSENQRRYVRLQISSPMSLSKVKDIFGNFWPEGDNDRIDGDILNISGGGVLVEISQSLNKGDIVAMRFSLQGTEILDDVLGTVKRADYDQECCLAGIEFINRDFLLDKLSDGELDLLSDRLSNFSETVEDVLKKYIYYDRVTSREQ